MKGLQERNFGSHHLGRRAYGGKRSKWAKEDAEAASLGIQRKLAQIIMKEVVGKTGMFYGEGQMSREDVRTWIASQRLDMKHFTKLEDYLPDMDGWHDMVE